MTPAAYDVLVVGAGGVGAACLSSLARRGLRVLGLESERPGHAGCASRSTRGFRQAYPVEDATYVPLARRSFELWRALEAERDLELLVATEALEIGPREHPAVAGVAQSCRRHGLPFEILEPGALSARFPALRPGPDEIAVVEKQAGILLAAAATRALLAQARDAGARLLERARVDRIEHDGSGVTLWARGEAFRAEHAVLAPGAGLPALLAQIAWPGGPTTPPLRVARPQELWFAPEPMSRFGLGALPLLSWAQETGSCFAIPAACGDGLKVCYRAAASGQRDPDGDDEDRVRAFMRRSMPAAASAPLAARHLCVSTSTPDRHPLLGAHPHAARIWLAGGLSGHGFKLAPALGEAIAELICDGGTRHGIAPFAPSRLAAAPAGD